MGKNGKERKKRRLMNASFAALADSDSESDNKEPAPPSVLTQRPATSAPSGRPATATADNSDDDEMDVIVPEPASTPSEQ
jgi:hypothetical protein